MTDEQLSHDELEVKLQEAAKAGDYKAIRTIARSLEVLEKAEVTAKKDALQKVLAELTSKVKGKLDAVVNKMKDAGDLDGADGVWYSHDFGSTDTSCRLTAKAARKAGSGSGSGNGSYVSHPAKTADLLAQVGENVMFAEDTVVTIDKQSQTMPAGATFKFAYDFSNNGGWRNRCRMALLKEAGLV